MSALESGRCLIDVSDGDGFLRPRRHADIARARVTLLQMPLAIQTCVCFFSTNRLLAAAVESRNEEEALSARRRRRFLTFTFLPGL